MVIKRKLSQRLKEVRLAWCDRQLIDGSPLDPELKKSIFLTWRGTRLFDVSTCKGMGVKMDPGSKFGNREGFNDGKIHVNAWTADTFDQYKKQKELKQKWQTEHPLDEDAEEEETQEKEEAKEPTMRLVVKSKDYPEFKVVVKNHTPIEKLINAFRTRNEISAERIVEFQFDGEVLQPHSAAGDADLEDMSSVDAYVR